MAAGTATLTEEVYGTVKKIKWAWTSGTDAAAGTVTSATTGYYSGIVSRLVTDPGATAPTDNYDITITDGDSVDVLNGAGANRDTTNTEQVNAGMGAVANTKLTLNITNAGDAKTGTAILYIV